MCALQNAKNLSSPTLSKVLPLFIGYFSELIEPLNWFETMDMLAHLILMWWAFVHYLEQTVNNIDTKIMAKLTDVVNKTGTLNCGYFCPSFLWLFSTR